MGDEADSTKRLTELGGRSLDWMYDAQFFHGPAVRRKDNDSETVIRRLTAEVRALREEQERMRRELTERPPTQEMPAETVQAPRLARAKQTRLIAHLDEGPPFLILDDERVATFEPMATRYVAELIELNGGRISVPEFKRANPECEGTNPTRFLRKIPKCILRYIEHGKGHIPRLKVEELL